MLLVPSLSLSISNFTSASLYQKSGDTIDLNWTHWNTFFSSDISEIKFYFFLKRSLFTKTIIDHHRNSHRFEIFLTEIKLYWTFWTSNGSLSQQLYFCLRIAMRNRNAIYSSHYVSTVKRGIREILNVFAAKFEVIRKLGKSKMSKSQSRSVSFIVWSIKAVALLKLRSKTQW